MPRYVIADSNIYSSETIETEMFGANFVTSHDFAFSQQDELNTVLETLGVSSFRFPGGGVTEGEFAEASFMTGNWSADSILWNDEIKSLTPLSAFFETAAEVSANVQLVIPTRVAFDLSAGQALATGQYGHRETIDPQYFDLLRNYVEEALAQANANGIEISRFEIGNEFWLGGEMSAAEYGFVSAEIANFLNDEFPGIDIITQLVATTGRFSPVEAREVYLEPDGAGDYIIHFANAFDGLPPSDWPAAIMPANGNTNTQTNSIADALLSNPPAAQIIDGVVEHVYFSDGFEGVDNERDFALRSIFDTFSNAINRSDLDYFITEWSPRNPRNSDVSDNLGNANGLQYAHMTVEAFFELSSNGVDGANFWPMTFANPNTEYRTLIDIVDRELTFGGVAFSWLSTATVGMTARADFEVIGEISVHAFGSETEIALFVGDRDGHENTGTNAVVLNMDELGVSEDYFVVISGLTSENGEFDDISGNAVVATSGGTIVSGDLSFELLAWELALVEIQIVTAGDDRLHGSNLSDFMRGEGGDDWINGFEGNDTLKGQLGHDTLRGDDGEDVLKGGWGDDLLFGGTGDDLLEGGHGADELHGGRGNDVIWGQDGNDTIFSGPGTDLAFGGAGNDIIYLQTNEVHEGGLGGLNVSGNGQVGTGVFIAATGMNRYSDVVYGGVGTDTVVLSNQDDAYFLHDGYSELHQEVETLPTSWGDDTAARFQEIEILDAGAGNDLVDLTSDTFTSGGVTILGGEGNDTIWGSSSGERIEGGAGADVLFGGAGADTLLGGTGSDVFEFTCTSTESRLEDFSIVENDRLAFYGGSLVVFDEGSLRLNGSFLEIDYVDSFEVDGTVRIELSAASLAAIQAVGIASIEFDLFA
ncbi:MAG: hypothetical protein GJ677_10715 [Rhodobacteraceae bacterium]|nr:hypothetical protein [Paracoccaceae bacterium]